MASKDSPSSHNPAASSLSEEQMAAVNSDAPVTLVDAAAGSGKTSVCAAWVSRQIAEGVHPDNILLLTFTRRAAAEMATRAAREADIDPSAMQAGTFHSIAAKVLQDHDRTAPASTVLDQDDAWILWRRAAEKSGTNEDFDLKRTVSMVSFATNTEKDVTSWLTMHHPSPQHALAVWKEYESAKKKADLRDYDDLLVDWRNRMRDDRAFRERVQRKFTHVLIDEVQDTNPLQHAILSYLNPRRVFAVGDPWQSIYGFRGSVPELARTMTDSGGVQKSLSTNYRCSQAVVRLSNMVTRLGKTQQNTSARSHAEPGSVFCSRPADPDTEVQEIVQWAKGTIERGTPAHDLAVLARSGRILSRIGKALREADIPYEVYGGSASNPQNEAMKDFSRLARSVVNPKDTIALKHALALFPGVGDVRADAAIGGKKLAGPTSDAMDLIKTWRSSARRSDTLTTMGDWFANHVLSNRDNWNGQMIASFQSQVRSLSSIDQVLEASIGDSFAGQKNNALTLSTVHSAKGLEWNSVWVAGVGQSTFPSPRSRKEDIEEERRLMYVAVTRAKNTLHLSAPLVDMRGRPQAVSCLLSPIPLRWPHGTDKPGRKHNTRSRPDGATVDPNSFERVGQLIARAADRHFR